jgi:hypothetical protein
MQNPSILLALTVFLANTPSFAKGRFDLAPVEPIPARKVLAPVKLQPSATPRTGELTVTEKAKKINAMPLPLIPSPDEAADVAKLQLSAEAQQLADLWDATLQKSPEIQIVINALQPNSDPNKARSQAMKLLGGAIFSGLQTSSMFLGGTVPRMGAGAAGSMLESVWSAKTKDKQPDLSPATMASLYAMIRHTADRLVDCHRSYTAAIDRAVYDEEAAEDTHQLMTSTRELTADQQLSLHLALKNDIRNIRENQRQIRNYRQQLVDLAGPHAVARLDEQIAEQHNALAKLTGTSKPFRDPLMYTPPSTARF